MPWKDSKKAKEYTKAYQKQYYVRFPNKQWENKLKKYGLSLDNFNQMHNTQKGKCVICLKPPSGKNKKLCVDHNHETGKVRALLCHRCNMLVGCLENEKELVYKIMDYVKRYE